jgi:hypothetical protein
MRFSIGQRVMVIALNDRPGRIIGGQDNGRIRRPAYLVRYEVESGPSKHYESSLFLREELKPG